MPKQPTARMWRKAARLLHQQRVRVLPGAHGRFGCEAEVRGDTGTYMVTITPRAEECECKFASFHSRRRCTHILAVLMVWRAVYPREGEDDGREAEAAAVRSDRSAG